MNAFKFQRFRSSENGRACNRSGAGTVCAILLWGSLFALAPPVLVLGQGHGGSAHGGGHAGGGHATSGHVSSGTHVSVGHVGAGVGRGHVSGPSAVRSGDGRAALHSGAGQRLANYGAVRPAPIIRQAPVTHSSASARSPIILSGANATHGAAPAGNITTRGHSAPTVVAAVSGHSSASPGGSYGGSHVPSFGGTAHLSTAGHVGMPGHVSLSSSHLASSFSGIGHHASANDHHLPLGGHHGFGGGHPSFFNPFYFGHHDDHHHRYFAPFAFGLYAGSYGYWGSPGYSSDPYYTEPYYVDPSYYAAPNSPVVVGPGYYVTNVNTDVDEPPPADQLEILPPVRLDLRRLEIPDAEAPEALPEDLKTVPSKEAPPKAELPEDTARPRVTGDIKS